MKPDLGKKELVEKIAQKIHENGKITFAEFMEACLYYPGLGYYNSDRQIIGRGGDYYTSPDIHPVFGRLIARQLNQMADLIGRDRFDILEMGAGKGILAKDILDSILKNYPDLYKRINYIILEKSAPLKSQQKKLISQFRERSKGKVSWIGDLHDLGSSLAGCVVSNEFFDALPVHRVKMVNGRLKELFVKYNNGRFVELTDDPSTGKLNKYLEKIRIKLDDDSIAEINLEAIRIMTRLGELLDKGFVITIDYGHHAHDLFSPSRRLGTLLCYYKHTLGADPFIRIGEQDITTHVDFSSIAMAGKEAGLEVSGFTDQMSFLLGLGIAQEMESAPKEEFEAMKKLILPDAMGRTFKVLIQHKGIEKPAVDGLRFKAFFDPSILFAA